ncbi:MAG TPA: family 10 glycosylhydrolase, partial [Candidatus Paceibacterota bacterium]|nr:family 10 glycosylhydrolase [Candidatus Paceibacterota bacterium]
LILFLVAFAMVLAGCKAVSYEPANVNPPKLEREFRGLWIVTVANIDWPSKPGLSTSVQKAELVSIFDRAARLNFNAVVFQVRPACDAFYASKLEPWSEYLTGVMGKAPEPYYDPLAFAISEAHKRGLELHAWFNPYRALHKTHEGAVASSHISKTHPELVKRYGQYLWLDPGEREVQEHSTEVVMDVVKRYDIDGVHFDDYFYPDPAEAGIAFPDGPSWKKFGAGGRLSLEDWRRENVNRFIENIYRSVKAAKPWVKFGVSPHGIWRPGNPPQIKSGSDTYAKLFADTRKWLANGWVDYFSPQLYWQIHSEYSFPILLDWWQQQNVKGRHIWPGMSAAFALTKNWDAQEIPNQIRLTRERRNVSGYIIYNTTNLFANRSLIGNLERELNKEKALIPASTWLASAVPAKPSASVSGNPESLKLTWRPGGGTNSIRWWVVQTKSHGGWATEILPSDVASKNLGIAPDAIAVTAVDRFGNASSPMMLRAGQASMGKRLLLKQ